MGLDLNRGCLQRSAKDERGQPTGSLISMYIGCPPDFKEAEPGVYYNEAGTEVPEEVAAAAGFDVKRHALEKKAAERRVQFDREEAERRKQDEKALQAELDIDVSGRTDSAIARAKESGFELRHMGGRHWNVFDRNGNAVSEKNFLKPDAVKLLETLELSEPAAPEPEEREAASA